MSDIENYTINECGINISIHLNSGLINASVLLSPECTEEWINNLREYFNEEPFVIGYDEKMSNCEYMNILKPHVFIDIHPTGKYWVSYDFLIYVLHARDIQNASLIMLTFKTIYDTKYNVKRLCPICITGITDTDIVYTHPCRHPFHKKCLTEWATFKKTCPMCRTNIVLLF